MTNLCFEIGEEHTHRRCIPDVSDLHILNLHRIFFGLQEDNWRLYRHSFLLRYQAENFLTDTHAEYAFRRQ